MDIFPWSKPGNDIFAYDADQAGSPGSKMPGTTRYLIEFEIPDPAKPDMVIQAEAKEERDE
jgi:hypothetical protein